MPFTSSFVHPRFFGRISVGHILCWLCFVLVLFRVCPKLPVSLDYPYLITASGFSDLYLLMHNYSTVGNHTYHYRFISAFFHFEFPIHFFNWVVSQEITIGLGLWCLMPLSTIFQLYRGGQLYWLRKRIPRRKSLTCRKSLTIFITLYWIQLAWAGFEFTMLVVIRHGVIVISCNRLHFFM
jgi:hypothetical protein